MAKADIYGCLTQFLADCKRYKTRKGKAGGAWLSLSISLQNIHPV
ncbi:hypothetical protein SynBMKMC1_02343 [Synechococcus sp. BMK-MC-1]|nr:hypothetical protein SynBMKMC1_02343 [Synechococcus sp. BMK-MC-1]